MPQAATPADPYLEFRALVRDPLTLRVLRSYVERRRVDTTTSLHEAAGLVAAAIRRGGLAPIVAEASKPEAVWREERELSAVLLRACASYAGREVGAETLEKVRTLVETVCAQRYPRQAPRYVRRVVRGAVAHTLHRLELRVPMLVAALAGLRAN